MTSQCFVKVVINVSSYLHTYEINVNEHFVRFRMSLTKDNRHKQSRVDQISTLMKYQYSYI